MSTTPAAESAALPAGRAAPTACAYSYHRVNELEALGRLVGRTFDCAVVFNAQSSWDAWERPWFTVHSDPNLNWARWRNAAPGRSVVVTQPMIVDGAPSDWRARGAAGEYDLHATRLANNLVSSGLGDAVIRLGHEMNGDWFVHNVGTTTESQRAWAAYWRRIVVAMRAVPGAAFRFDWCPNAGYRAISLDAYYPGDDVVDIVGFDHYDYDLPNRPRTVGAERWSQQINQPGGVATIVAFAEVHGKPMSIPEWGLVSDRAARPGLGDNPAFVDAIADLLAEHDFVYQSYFNAVGSGTLPLSTETPAAVDAYRRHFGSSAG